MKHFLFAYYRLCLLGIILSMASCNADTQSQQTGVSTSQTNTTAATTSNNNTQGPEATVAAGKWEATISNGYKGDKLTFTVSADGKWVENVAFTGYWRSRSSGTEVLMNLDPPKPYEVSNGNFSAVQQEDKAGMWWEFIGRFTSPTTAEGSYRCSFAGGENDTYKLQWTARYVGAK